MKHPAELKYYSTHSTLESAEGFIKQIKDFVSYKLTFYDCYKKSEDRETRTPNLLIWSQTLYQLSYSPEVVFHTSSLIFKMV